MRNIYICIKMNKFGHTCDIDKITMQLYKVTKYNTNLVYWNKWKVYAVHKSMDWKLKLGKCDSLINRKT